MMSEKTSYKDSIDTIAANYSRDIAWLGAIHVSLKSGQTNISPLAGALLVYPERHILINHLSPKDSRLEFIKTVKLFKKLCKFASSPPFTDTGHYLNMSAILHLDSLLQGYLDSMFQEACKYGLINVLPESSFPPGNKKIPEIQKEQEDSIRNMKLKGDSIGSKLDKMFGTTGYNELANTTLTEERHAKFIAQLRHIITHNEGFVDMQFLNKCGIRNTGKGKKHWNCPTPLWDTVIWPDIDLFLSKYPPPDSAGQYQASLEINTVVLPYIGHAVDFVTEIKNIFVSI